MNKYRVVRNYTVAEFFDVEAASPQDAQEEIVGMNPTLERMDDFEQWVEQLVDGKWVSIGEEEDGD